MLIAVVGTSGLGRVAGVLSGSPAALLRVVADRPDTDVVVLTSGHARASAQRQADLVAAARPSARVSVITSPHHALTLTVVADRVLAAAPWLSSADDLRGLLRTELSRARSLVWSPAAWRLRGVDLGVGARLRSLVGGRNPVLDIAPATDIGPDGWLPAAGDRVYTTGPLPAPLTDRLDGHHPQRVTTLVEDSRFASGSAWLLTSVPFGPVTGTGSTDPGAATPEPPAARPRPAAVDRESEAA